MEKHNERWRRRRAISNSWPKLTVLDSSILYTELRGLEKFSNYCMYAVAFTKIGDSNATNTTCVLTDEDGRLFEAFQVTFCQLSLWGWRSILISQFVRYFVPKCSNVERRLRHFVSRIGQPFFCQFFSVNSRRCCGKRTTIISLDFPLAILNIRVINKQLQGQLLAIEETISDKRALHLSKPLKK